MVQADQHAFKQLKVLLVDDNEHTIALLTRILRGFGVHTISKANDGASAFDLLRVRSFDLIICDWNMKPIDGLKFCVRVRKSKDSPNPYVPIIMLTGHTEIDRVMEARDAGFNDFLAKPVAPATLLTRMKAVLDKHEKFIESGGYRGPDRRRKRDHYSGPERRGQPAGNEGADGGGGESEDPSQPTSATQATTQDDDLATAAKA